MWKKPVADTHERIFSKGHSLKDAKWRTLTGGRLQEDTHLKTLSGPRTKDAKYLVWAHLQLITFSERWQME